MSARSDAVGRMVSGVAAAAACAVFAFAANSAEHRRPAYIPGPPAVQYAPGAMPSAMPTVHGGRALRDAVRPVRHLVRYSVRVGYYSSRSGWSR